MTEVFYRPLFSQINFFDHFLQAITVTYQPPPSQFMEPSMSKNGMKQHLVHPQEVCHFIRHLAVEELRESQ